MNDKKREIIKNLTEQQKEQLRTFIQRTLVEAEIFYPQPDEGIVLDYGELGERFYDTTSLKKMLLELKEELK